MKGNAMTKKECEKILNFDLKVLEEASFIRNAKRLKTTILSFQVC